MSPELREKLLFLTFAIGFVLGTTLFLVFSYELYRELYSTTPYTGPFRSLPRPLILATYVYALVVPFCITTLTLRSYLHVLYERTPPPYPEGSWPPIAIIIPVYKERENIERSLESLDDLTYPGSYKVIVVLDGEDHELDGTPELVRMFVDDRKDGKFIVLQKPNGGKASALNLGLAEAGRQGVEFVMCVDGDSMASRDVLERMVVHFNGTDVVAATGQVQVRNWLGGTGSGEHGTFPFLEGLQALEYVYGCAFLKRSQSLFRIVNIIPGPTGMFRLDILQEIAAETPRYELCGQPTHPEHGPYPYETLAEDMDLTFTLLRWSWRHGCGGIIYEPRAIVATDGRHKLKDLFRQRYRWMRGTLTSATRHLKEWAGGLDGECRRKTTDFDVPIVWSVAVLVLAAAVALYASSMINLVAAIALAGVAVVGTGVFHWLRTDRDPAMLGLIGWFTFASIFCPPIFAIANLSFVWIAFFDWESSASGLCAWYFGVMILNLNSCTFSVIADGQSLWLVPYSLLGKPIYGLVLDTFKFVGMIDVIFGVPAVWHQRYVVSPTLDEAQPDSQGA